MRTNETDEGPSCRSRRQVLAAAGALGASVVAGCIGSGDDGSDTGGNGDGNTPTAAGVDGPSSATPSMAGDGGTGGATGTTSGPLTRGEQPTAASDAAWRSVELSPVRRDETVTVSSFDRPVVLEAFAVWCPKCTRKQEELEGLDDGIVKISINIDPNEDATTVREHANEHGFGWRYAVAPPEMVQSLVDAFGTTVTNAPSTPVVVACPGDGSSFFAGRGNTGISKIETTADGC
jgi:hypothetical protein